MFQGHSNFGFMRQQCGRKLQLSRFGEAVLEVIFPEDTRIRSRKVVTRSRARSTGKYPSWKMGRMVQWESENELNAYRCLDMAPEVKAFHEQPLLLKYMLNGEEHYHYPDVLVDYGDSRELWEIKPKAQALKQEYVDRTLFLEAMLPKLGFTYRMVLAEELAAQPRLDTVLALLKHGRNPVTASARESVRRVLLGAPVVTWGQASNGYLGINGRSILARLVLEGVLSCDIGQRLTPTTQFSMSFEKSSMGVTP